jgi:hypothetical protein
MTSHTTLARSSVPFVNLVNDAKIDSGTVEPRKPSRRLNIPNAVPDKFDTMLRTCAMLCDAGAVEDGAKARACVAGAWMNLNRKDPRYAALAVWADACEEPALRIFSDFRPEGLTDAALRVLRAIKKMHPQKLGEAVGAFGKLGLIEAKDLANVL